MDFSRTISADVTRTIVEDGPSFRARYESLVETVDCAIVELGSDARITRLNDAAERLCGSSSINRLFSDLVAEPPTTFLPSPARKQERLALHLIDDAGRTHRVSGNAMVIVEDDVAQGWILAFRERERHEEIEQLKNELVSAVSHELRTPLATIKAYTATLRANPWVDDSAREEFLSVVEEQADRLSRLIEDVLIVSRVDAAYLLRHRAFVPLQPLIERIAREIHLDEERHPLRVDVGECGISGDSERLYDVFRNLLENAVKYSPEGGEISVRATLREERVVVEIEDRGLGILADHLPYIFDRFYRVDGTPSSLSGSGLGLFIVNGLVRAHRGTIDVRSTPGSGSTFTLAFPVHQ